MAKQAGMLAINEIYQSYRGKDAHHQQLIM